MRQRLVGGARLGPGLMLRGQRGDLVFAEKGEKIQVAHHVAVVGADPELVEAIDAGFAGVHPDGPGRGLAEFRAVAVENERQGEAKNMRAQFFPGQFHAGGDVAPLIELLLHCLKSLWG